MSTAYTCALCGVQSVKRETYFVSEQDFAFARMGSDSSNKRNVPTSSTAGENTLVAYTPGSYCLACYNHTIAPAQDRYAETLDQARNIKVFEIQQSKETRLMSRKESLLHVDDIYDRDEAVMRLAFKAVQMGFNTLIDLKTDSVKVKNGKHQHLVWSAQARPTNT